MHNGVKGHILSQVFVTVVFIFQTREKGLFQLILSEVSVHGHEPLLPWAWASIVHHSESMWYRLTVAGKRGRGDGEGEIETETKIETETEIETEMENFSGRREQMPDHPR